MASQEEAAAGKSNDLPPEYTKLLNAARIAESAERYPDMANYLVDAIAKNGNKLDKDGRDQFSVAFKNIIGARRQQWRIIKQKKTDADSGSKDDYPKEMINDFKERIEAELEHWCGKVLGHINTLLEACPKESEDKADNEDKINYLKMIGDYNRYRAEYLEGEKQKTVKDAASEAYKKAVNLASAALEETDPTRLGLMLNYSVFNYEVLKNRDQACTLAKTAFDAAIAKLDTLNDTSYKDSTLIMQLLRDNLTLWTSENDDKTNNPEED